MVNLIGLYKDVKDVEQFDEFYVNKVIPITLKIPRVIKMIFSSLVCVSKDQKSGADDINIMVETHFESLEALQAVFSSPEIMGMVQEVIDFSTMGVYLADGKTLYASDSVHAKKGTEWSIKNMKELNQ